MEHVVASVRLFDDGTCETQVVAAGPRDECERLAGLNPAVPYQGSKNIIAEHIVVRERHSWDVMIGQFEADERVVNGRKPS